MGAHRGDREAAFIDLAAMHDTSDRYYHRFAHASAVVDAVLSLHSGGDNWAVGIMAAWYHDAVYDARAARGTNEGASAVVAVEALTGLGASLTATGAVARLIALTASHHPATGDRIGQVLCDADLSILGADDDAYDAYTVAVRAEYAHVADADWLVGRRRVLRTFLDRPAIFRTEAASAAWEATARGNISRELSQLARMGAPA